RSTDDSSVAETAPPVVAVGIDGVGDLLDHRIPVRLVIGTQTSAVVGLPLATGRGPATSAGQPETAPASFKCSRAQQDCAPTFLLFLRRLEDSVRASQGVLATPWFESGQMPVGRAIVPRQGGQNRPAFI